MVWQRSKSFLNHKKRYNFYLNLLNHSLYEKLVSNYQWCCTIHLRRFEYFFKFMITLTSNSISLNELSALYILHFISIFLLPLFLFFFFFLIAKLTYTNPNSPVHRVDDEKYTQWMCQKLNDYGPCSCTTPPVMEDSVQRGMGTEKPWKMKVHHVQTNWRNF